MIKSSLGTLHPGWETKKAFLQIYLAVGMPVVARLQFGSTSKVAMGREEVFSLGVDLGEGQTMNFIITVSDRAFRPIEIEICRRNISPAELAVSGPSS